AELLDNVTALLLTAGDPHRATALDLGDLTDDAADGAGRAGDHDGLALLGLADLQYSEVLGHPGHAERPQVDGQGRERGVDLDQPVALHPRVLLNPGDAGHVVAGLEPR